MLHMIVSLPFGRGDKIRTIPNSWNSLLRILHTSHILQSILTKLFSLHRLGFSSLLPELRRGLRPPVAARLALTLSIYNHPTDAAFSTNS